MTDGEEPTVAGDVTREELGAFVAGVAAVYPGSPGCGCPMCRVGQLAKSLLRRAGPACQGLSSQGDWRGEVRKLAEDVLALHEEDPTCGCGNCEVARAARALLGRVGGGGGSPLVVDVNHVVRDKFNDFMLALRAADVAAFVGVVALVTPVGVVAMVARDGSAMPAGVSGGDELSREVADLVMRHVSRSSHLVVSPPAATS